MAALLEHLLNVPELLLRFLKELTVFFAQASLQSRLLKSVFHKVSQEGSYQARNKK